MESANKFVVDIHDNIPTDTKIEVVVYAGQGTSRPEVVTSFLQVVLRGKATVVHARTLSEVKDALSSSNARLFVVPGGADLPYCNELNGEGTRAIKAFVQSGRGSYLGICAGAYFGSAKCEFAVGTNLEVVGDRELSFFKGTACGPHLRPYSYTDNSGCEATGIFREGDERGNQLFVYMNGGCAFHGASEVEDVIVLYRYTATNAPAIVSTRVGAGVAILSGVHFEVGPPVSGFDECPFHRQVWPILELNYHVRISLAEEILKVVIPEVFEN